jgi:hypothetical protein
MVHCGLSYSRVPRKASMFWGLCLLSILSTSPQASSQGWLHVHLHLKGSQELPVLPRPLEAWMPTAIHSLQAAQADHSNLASISSTAPSANI